MTNPGPEDSLFEDVPDEPAIPIEDAVDVGDDTPYLDDDGTVAEDDANLFATDDIASSMEPAVAVVRPGLMQRVEDKVFGLLHRKKKVAVKKEQPPAEDIINEPAVDPVPQEPTVGEDERPLPPDAIGDLPEIDADSMERWLQMPRPPVEQKKERPIVRIAIAGLAMLFFAAGAFSIYSELPTHPTLVFGIILMSVSGSVLVNAK